MQIKWANTASKDLDRIEKFIAEDNPLAAINQIILILEHVEEILPMHPKIGRKGKVPFTRELVIIGTPFIVIYKVESDEVNILRVLHGAQQWPKVSE